VCTASGPCESTTHSDETVDETVVLQYGIKHISANTEAPAVEVSSSETTHGTAERPTTSLPVISLPAAATAETASEDRSTASFVQCTNWTDIVQLR